MPVPAHPKIYHIVHVDNLASIVADGCLWSDAIMAKRQGITVIGMGNIKQRRLTLPISCHFGLAVGDCVPFYFCPRSVMLFVISRANHGDLGYQGGQEPVVHLEADLRETIGWADEQARAWAFSTINAAHGAAEFFNDLAELAQIDWAAVGSRYWTDCRDQKQAELLIKDTFPWHLVRRIGVRSKSLAQKVYDAMGDVHHRPTVQIAPEWYY